MVYLFQSPVAEPFPNAVASEYSNVQITKHWKALTILGFAPTGDLGPLTGYTSKRGKAVWYLKAPPKTPATSWQQQQRNMFKLIAAFWQGLPAAQRQDWMNAARGAGLNITGYNLFVWYQYTLDAPVINTIERQSGITLLPIS